MIKKNKFYEYIDLELAEKKMLKSITKNPNTTKIHIKEAENRILSENIYANENIPEENNSAVDGYAINNNDFKIKNKFKIIGGIQTRGTTVKKNKK